MAKRKRTKGQITKTKDQTTRTPLKPEAELGCSGMVRRSCSTSGTHRVTLDTNSMISHE